MQFFCYVISFSFFLVFCQTMHMGMECLFIYSFIFTSNRNKYFLNGSLFLLSVYLLSLYRSLRVYISMLVHITYTVTCTYIYTHTCTQTYTHAHRERQWHTHTYIRIDTSTYTYKHLHTPTLTYTHIYKHLHPHTPQIHIH